MSLDAWGYKGAKLAADAFNAGVQAVVACIYGNAAMGEFGIGGSIPDEVLERIRALRKKVNGKYAYPNQRPAKKPRKSRSAP